MSKQIFIYGLVDPREPKHIRYVGKTDSPSERVREHIWEGNSYNTYKGNWVASLLVQHVKPEIVILEITDDSNWPAREQCNIAQLRQEGHRLTNGNDGGIGGVNPTPETREKLRRAKIGRILSAEVKARISGSSLGKTHTDAAKAKMAAARVGTRHSEATKQLMSTRAKGRTHTPESIEKMSQVKRGKQFSQAHKNKLSEAAKLRHKKNRLINSGSNDTRTDK